MDKISKKNAKELKLKFYYTGIECSRGHIAERYVASGKCAICERNKSAINRKNNKEKIKLQLKDWRERNKDIIKEKKKQYRIDNKEKIKEKDARYYQENKDKFKVARREYAKWYHQSSRAKKLRRDRNRKIRNTCPRFKSIENCRRPFQRIINNLKTMKEPISSTVNSLGYNHIDLKSHVEQYMINGMTWGNFGSYWCLDHRYPVVRMVDDGIDDPLIINHLHNLRPLLSQDNSYKWAYTEEEYFDLNPNVKLLYPEMPVFNPLEL